MNVITRKKTKSTTYLFPCLLLYERDFKFAIGELNGIELFLGIKGEYEEEDNIIAIKFTLTQNKRVINALKLIRKQPYYVNDFTLEHVAHALNGEHVIIIKLKDKCKKARESFLKGKYSEMFSNEDLDVLFNSEGKKILPAYQVFTRSKEAESRMLQYLKEEYDVTYKRWSGELDLPPKKEKEYL